MLLPAFYLSEEDVGCKRGSCRVRGGELMVGYLYFSQAQDLDFVPDSLEQNWICGNFPTIVMTFTMVGIFIEEYSE